MLAVRALDVARRTAPVERAVAWLARHHREAFAAALEIEIDGAAFGCFDDDDDDAVREAMAGIDDALWQQLQINLTERLLAEGDILVKGGTQRVADLLLGSSGPLLSLGQRAWAFPRVWTRLHWQMPSRALSSAAVHTGPTSRSHQFLWDELGLQR